MLKLKYKLISSFLVGSGGIATFCTFAIWKNDERFYKNILMPLVHKLEPESSHRLAILTSKWMPGFLMRSRFKDEDILKSKLWKLTFASPIGLAAGFDKHGEAVPALFRMGFSFVEVGSVTPQPQTGNPKPRLFRLNEDQAVINRYGFNSLGHDQVKKNLNEIKNTKSEGILAVNLGQNKSSEDPCSDYVKGIMEFGPMADFLVVNVSSPNTPGLRNLQKKKALENLIEKVLLARKTLEKQVPILVKIAPDVTQEELKDIADIVIKKKIDGIVISNTTIARPETLQSPLKTEVGGLSGRPLKLMSTKMIQQMYILTQGQVPIIGVGGVESGSDAYEKIRSGASLIELYTALVYQGPPVIDRIKRELTDLLKKDGFSSVSEAVGTNSKA